VVSSDLKRFMLQADKLFPGAKIRAVGNIPGSNSVTNKVLERLKATEDRILTAKEIENELRKPWRKISSDVITPFFKKHLAAIGWEYKPVAGKVGRGKLGTRFERIAPMEHEGALSAYMSEAQRRPSLSVGTH
jgi:hypothetical protein